MIKSKSVNNIVEAIVKILSINKDKIESFNEDISVLLDFFNKCKNSKITPDYIKSVVNSVGLSSNEIFLSEADLQFNFAQVAEKCGATNIILEYPIMTKDLYCNCKYDKRKKSFTDNDRTYIDVYFEFEQEKYFIELKYKTLKLQCTRHFQINNNKIFNLTDQASGNFHAIYEDIERMENVKSSLGQECRTYSLTITNDKNYWGSKNRGRETKVKKFSLFKEDNFMNEKYKKEENKTTCGNLEYEKKCELYVDNGYYIEWSDLKNINCNNSHHCGLFRYLLIDLQHK